MSGGPNNEEFGAEKHLALLNLLAPAFIAGVRMMQHLATTIDNLGRLVDTLGVGTLIAGTRGRIVHQNPFAPL